MAKNRVADSVTMIRSPWTSTWRPVSLICAERGGIWGPQFCWIEKPSPRCKVILHVNPGAVSSRRRLRSVPLMLELARLAMSSTASRRAYPTSPTRLVQPGLCPRSGFLYFWPIRRNPASGERKPGSSQPVADPVAGKRFQIATGPDSTRDRTGCSWNISLIKRVQAQRLSPA